MCQKMYLTGDVESSHDFIQPCPDQPTAPGTCRSPTVFPNWEIHDDWLRNPAFAGSSLACGRGCNSHGDRPEFVLASSAWIEIIIRSRVCVSLRALDYVQSCSVKGGERSQSS